MSVDALMDEPPGTTDSPFQLHTSKASEVMGVKEAMGGVSFEGEDRTDTGAFFFGANKQGAGPMKNKRRRRDDDNGDNEDNDTLYLGPLAPGMNGDGLKQQLASAIPGIESVLQNVRERERVRVMPMHSFYMIRQDER
jgi:hypothetical protein